MGIDTDCRIGIGPPLATTIQTVKYQSTRDHPQHHPKCCVSKSALKHFSMIKITLK